MLQLIKINLIPHDKPSQEITGLLYKTAFQDFPGHLLTQGRIVRLRQLDLRLRHLHIKQEFIFHDFIFRNKVIENLILSV